MLRFIVYSSCPDLLTVGDIVHRDDLTPKKLGCENNFILVIYPIFAAEICFHLFDLIIVLSFALTIIRILITFLDLFSLFAKVYFFDFLTASVGMWMHSCFVGISFSHL